MSKEKNYLGETIQANNSSVISSLNHKHDFIANCTYEQYGYLLSSIAKMIGTDLKLDNDKISLLCSLKNIGKIDGGDIALNRVNSLVPEEYKISEKDIAKYNFEKIYGDPQSVFSSEDFEEIMSMFEGLFKTNEAKAVDYAANIVEVTEYMKKNHSWTNQYTLKYIRSLVSSLEKIFTEKGLFQKDEKLVTVFSEMKKLTIEYDVKLIDEYVKNSFTLSAEKSKEKLIEIANDFHFDMEKKTELKRM